jgi:transcriptional regulator ATRX
MKFRSYVLNKKLSKFVQRKEAAILKEFLPEKYEYCLFVPLSPVQERLYEYFLKHNPLSAVHGGKSLLPDYTFLRKIWTHPKVLENAWIKAKLQQKQKIRKLLVYDSDNDEGKSLFL